MIALITTECKMSTNAHINSIFIAKKGHVFDLITALFVFPILFCSEKLFEKNYLSWCWLGCASLFVCLYLFFNTKQFIAYQFTVIDLVVTLYVLYIIGYSAVNKNFAIIPKHQIVFFLFPFFLSIKQTDILNISKVAGILLFLILIELIIIGFQLSGILSNANNYFKVGGSLGNPNVLSGFMAMSIPFVCYLYSIHEKRLIKCFIAIIVILAIVVLFSLKSRSAILGLGTYALFVYLTKSQKGIAHKLLISGIFILLIVVLFLWKSESGMGRLLIWWISLHVALKNPFLGTGFNSFQYHYLTEQTLFFKTHTFPNLEWISGQPQWAYNEILESWIEGGIPALILIVLLLLTPIVLFIKRVLLTTNPKIFFTLLGCYFIFLVLSLTNFTSTVYPITLIYFIVLGLLAKNLTSIFLIGKITYISIISIWIITGSYFFLSSVKYLPESYFVNQLTEKTEISKKEYTKLKHIADQYPDYSRLQAVLAQKAYKLYNVDSALLYINKATIANREADILLLKAKILIDLERYDEASVILYDLNFQTPNRITPVYYQFLIEKRKGNIKQAEELAYQLTNFKIKVTNNKTNIIKREASKYLIEQQYKNRSLQ